ncbi:myosin-M heavy chain-like [Mytilus edulis]|uniref:myosin-M heavy chain-like n=1 Tax=Mytilus edulis TaxID=6550 RepID=UPI0039F00C8C
MDIFQQPSTSSSSACSVTMVPATVKLIADSQIEKDASLPQMTHISRAERKKTDERKRKDQNDPECRKKQGTSGKIRKSDESLMAMLKEQQNEFLSNESKRWEEEKAREERMRKEDKEHELKLFSMFATIIKGQPSSQITSGHASSVSSFPSSSFQDSTFQASPLHSASTSSTSSTYHRPTSNVNHASFLPEASCSNMSFLRMLNNEDCF